MRLPNFLVIPSLLLGLLSTISIAAADDADTGAGGLQIEVTNPVECDDGAKTKNGDFVDMHYRGTLASDGSQFDASYDRNQVFSFQIGAGRVIKGWEQGLLNMCVGEKRKLTIPPELGYGARGVGPIPGGATLVFETELMGIQGRKDEL